VKPPSPKADALRAMREQQAEAIERARIQARRNIARVNATRDELEQAVRAASAKVAKPKICWTGMACS